MTVELKDVFVLSIDQGKIDPEEAGEYTYKVMLVDIKSKYSKFESSFTEYSLDLVILAPPVDNTTNSTEESVSDE